jgi:hypothetical protein
MRTAWVQGGAQARSLCIKGEVMAILAWVAKLSMRATAVFGNCYATHAQHKRGAQNFFQAASIGRRLLETHDSFLVLNVVIVCGSERVRHVPSLHCKFGKNLHKLIVLLQSKQSKFGAYLGIWADVLKAEERHRAHTGLHAALSSMKAAWTKSLQLHRKSLWRDGGVSLLSACRGGATPLQTLMKSIRSLLMNIASSLCQDARCAAESATTVDWAEKKNMWLEAFQEKALTLDGYVQNAVQIGTGPSPMSEVFRRLGHDRECARLRDVDSADALRRLAGELASRRYMQVMQDAQRQFQHASCAGCGQAESESGTFQYCAGCKSVSYCGTICQKEHWKSVHKQECSVRTSARPSITQLGR